MTELESKIENLKAPKRSGNECSASFEVPAKAKKSGAKDSERITGLDMRWVFDAKPSTAGVKKGKGDVVASDSTKKNTIKTDTEKLPRKKFYPYDGKKVLTSIEFWVRGYNVQSGKKVYGPWAHKALKPAKPDPPKSVSLSYDASNGRVTPKYVSEHPDGKKEVHDTQVWVAVDKGAKLYDGVAYTDETKTLTAKNVSGATTLGIGKYIKVTGKARNRGLGGKSDMKAANDLYICHPNPPVCGTPTLNYATKGVLSTAGIIVPIKNSGVVQDGKTKVNPTTVKLFRLKNSQTEDDATSAAGASGWTEVTSDDGVTKGLTDTWAEAVSDEGKYTWYRAAAIRDGYTTYGTPVRAKCIDVLSSSTTAGAASIDSVEIGADGKSAKVTLSGKQANDEGYEVSWSTAKDAWESTDPPDTFETAGSALVVKGLEEGTAYFARARAFDLDSEGNHVYGTYSATVTFTPYTTPSTVALAAPATVERGRDVQFSWTYDTEAQQTEWQLLDESGNAAHSGTGPTCACVVTAEEYGDAASLTYTVRMTTGGGWAKSAPMTVAIADAPTCAVTASSTLTAQPLGFTVGSDKGDSVRVSVTALGSGGTGLHGDREQFAGDTVYSGEFSPTWTNGVASIELPRGLAFNNGADYRLDVVAIDAATGLESEPASAPFAVAWSRTATQPTGTVSVDADAKAVTVTVTAPSDAAIGDTFDLYRVTPDGERRIAQAQPFGTAITDRLAPYTHDGQGLRYIAVTRTADGDACISDDIEYELAGGQLRFDWGGGDYVELPYNIKMEDEFSKDSEVRKHMDGTRQAYWNDGVTRKATLSTDIVRFRDEEQQELVRSMLQHAGSVFVRTPDGMAYAADVQPGTIERSFGSSAVGMSFKAVEHDLTDEDRPSEADIVQPTWTGGSLVSVGGTVYDNAGKFPLYDWRTIGRNGNTLYVYDPDGKVRNGNGTVQTNWTWDGEVLKNAQGTVINVTGE